MEKLFLRVHGWWGIHNVANSGFRLKLEIARRFTSGVDREGGIFSDSRGFDNREVDVDSGLAKCLGLKLGIAQWKGGDFRYRFRDVVHARVFLALIWRDI